MLTNEENYTRTGIFRSTSNGIERFVTETGVAKKTNPKVPFGLGRTTVSFYISGIKKVVNEAIKARVIPQDEYPFGGEGYRIPKGKNTKKALPTEVISSVLGHSNRFSRRNYTLDI